MQESSLTHAAASGVRWSAGWRQSTPGGDREGLRAFTVIELLVVVAIVGLLSAVLLGVGQRANESGRVTRAKAELAALSAALESYRRQYGTYPQTSAPDELLQSLIGRRGPTGRAMDGRGVLELARFTTLEARDPFLDGGARLVDPWGNPYLYRYEPADPNWKNPGYVLGSAGPDGSCEPAVQPGGFADSTSRSNADNVYAHR